MSKLYIGVDINGSADLFFKRPEWQESGYFWNDARVAKYIPKNAVKHLLDGNSLEKGALYELDITVKSVTKFLI